MMQLQKVLVVGVMALVLGAAGPAGAGSRIYLSTVSLESEVWPAPMLPDVTLEVGESVTLYLWAEFGVGSSTAMGLDFRETNPAVVVGHDVQIWDGAINEGSEEYDAGDPKTWLRRWVWEAVAGMDGESVGFRASAPAGVAAAGLTSLYRGQDPTVRGSGSVANYYVGAAIFTAAAVGQSEIFLTVNERLIVGSVGMIGTPEAPGLWLGGGDPVAVAVLAREEGGGVGHYIAAGVTGKVADAKITVVPEAGTGWAVAVVGLWMGRSRCVR